MTRCHTPSSLGYEKQIYVTAPRIKQRKISYGCLSPTYFSRPSVDGDGTVATYVYHVSGINSAS